MLFTIYLLLKLLIFDLNFANWLYLYNYIFMKLILLFVIVIGISAYVFIPGTRKSIQGAAPRSLRYDNKGFSVVELFTSEGCSSCPLADNVVAKIQQEDTNLPVYILAYHVDYWNKLGWKDVFSNAQYSKRKNEYANWLNLGSVYTPQIVVNGKKEFVGSEEETLRKTIAMNLEQKNATSVSLEGLQINNHLISMNYHIDQSPADGVLQVVLVQKSGNTVVKRGENGGRTLSHVQIVRTLQNIDLKGNQSGSVSIDFPTDMNRENAEIIAFIQNPHSGEILGACKSPL